MNFSFDCKQYMCFTKGLLNKCTQSTHQVEKICIKFDKRERELRTKRTVQWMFRDEDRLNNGVSGGVDVTGGG